MLKAQWMAIRAGFAALCGCAVTGALADGTVPVEWNITPLKNGAYIETFGTVAETIWATGSSTQAVKTAVATVNNAPARANDWFGTEAKALALDTEGDPIDNALKNDTANSTSVATTTDKPVYLDMLVRFDAVEDEPDADMLTDAKLALYMNMNGNLVCYSNGGFATNSTAAYSTNEWNRVTVKLAGESFQVFMNDGADPLSFGSTDTFTVKGGTGSTTGTLSGTTFRGTGYLADLYVGYCDPKYGVAGATTAASKELSSDNKTALGDEALTRVNKWLADNSIAAGTGDDAAIKGYMLGADAPVSSADLSITSIDVVSPTQVKVKVGLAIGGEAKTGSINGVLRLEGAITEGGAYTLLNETVVTDAEFESGNSAEYTFDIPAGGYHIFKPVLSVQ